MKKNPVYPVRADMEWKKVGSWKTRDPYTIAFVFPKSASPYIAKGGLNDVEKWIKTNELRPSIVHYVMFHKAPAPLVIGGVTFNFSSKLPGSRRNISFINFNPKYIIYMSQQTKDYSEDGYRTFLGFFRKHFTLTVSEKVGQTSRLGYGRHHSVEVFSKSLRQVPHGWIKELNPFI